MNTSTRHNVNSSSTNFTRDDEGIELVEGLEAYYQHDPKYKRPHVNDNDSAYESEDEEDLKFEYITQPRRRYRYLKTTTGLGMTNQGESTNYLRGNYNERFDPRVYLDERLMEVNPGRIRKFILDNLHKFFEKGKIGVSNYSEGEEKMISEDIPLGITGSISEPVVPRGLLEIQDANTEVHGDRLLDIGTGPSIVSAISAMTKFRHIYLSDVARPCLDALWQWQRCDVEAHNFSPFFKYVINLEKSSENWEDRQNRLRGQIQGILLGDMYKDQPFEPCYFPAFDGIVSTLSVLGTDKEKDIRRACDLLKPGGWMIDVNLFQNTFYTVGDQTFYCDYVKVKDAVTCWEKCGLEIVDIITSLYPGDPPDGRICSAILARKL